MTTVRKSEEAVGNTAVKNTAVGNTAVGRTAVGTSPVQKSEERVPKSEETAQPTTSKFVEERGLRALRGAAAFSGRPLTVAALVLVLLLPGAAFFMAALAATTLFASLTATTANAQSTYAGVSGRVTDPSGAVIVEAEVQ